MPFRRFEFVKKISNIGIEAHICRGISAGCSDRTLTYQVVEYRMVIEQQAAHSDQER